MALPIARIQHGSQLFECGKVIRMLKKLNTIESGIANYFKHPFVVGWPRTPKNCLNSEFSQYGHKSHANTKY
jgi:hypothetical protein